MSTREGKGDNGGTEIFWNGLNACSEKSHGILALFFLLWKESNSEQFYLLDRTALLSALNLILF